MVNIKDLPDKTPVKKEKTGLVREAMLSFSEKRLSVKELAALLGVAYPVCSSMCNPESPVRMRFRHVKKFISHFPEVSIKDLLLRVDPAVPAEKLVETYFDLPGEYSISDPRQFINDMPVEIFRAILSAFANAGVVKNMNLSREVLLGTLLAKLHENYTVTLVNGRVVIRGEKDGCPVSIFLDGKFPWDTQKSEL